MRFIEEFLFDKKNKDLERELRFAEDTGIDELEDLKNKEIRREKLTNDEYYTEDSKEDL